MSAKLTIDYVTKEFASKGWKLISSTYIGSQLPLECICPEGHSTTISWNNFKAKQGCKFCAGNVKFTYEKVKEVFVNAGCELLELKYENNNTPMAYRCSCGNVGKIRFTDFREGVRCIKCLAQKNSELHQTPKETLAIFCESKGCKLVNNWLQNGRTRIKYICKCGREAEAYWTNFRKFPNCKVCGSDKIRGDKCHMWNPDREQVRLNKKYRKACERMLRRCLLKAGTPKQDHTYKLLGYTPAQLRARLESFPGYKPGMEIDHIFPVQAFIDHGITDPKIINALDNLQPLGGVANQIKADSYNKDEFKQWIQLFLGREASMQPRGVTTKDCNVCREN